MTNDYIKQRRAKFAEQLKDPAVRLQVAAMMLSEDAAYPLPVVESLFNRCDYSGKSILQMLHSGFYGPINRGRLPAFEWKIQHNHSLEVQMNAAIDQALGGSNVIQGFTDQGLSTDPNGRWPGGLRLHGEIFNDWGGGPGGHAGAQKWREAFMAGAKAAQSTVQDAVSHPSATPL